MKRILSIIICLSLIFGMMPVFGLSASGAEYTVMDKVPMTLGTENSYSPWGAPYQGGWVPVMGTESGQPDGGAFCAWSDAYYAEIVSEGNQDVGALHIKSAASTVAVGINIGMTPGETYTLGMWVKGSATNPNKVLSLYGNGDGTIIGAAEYSADSIVASTTIGDQWTYMERTFTANLNQLNLWAANWGENDIYIDNITVKNSAGADLMAGYGDFCTTGEVVKDSDITNEMTEAAYLDTSKSAAAYNATEKIWVPMYPQGTPVDGWPAWGTDIYAEIVANGYADAGSMHIVSAPGKNAVIAINAGMTVGETYTLGMWVKGSATNPNKVLSLFENGSGTIIGAAEYSADGVVGGTAIGDQWTYVERSFTANLSQLNIQADSWGENNIYIDNITLTDANGKVLLGCAGNFCHKAVLDAAVTPSCTVAGKSEGKHCSVCNEILVAQAEIAALGHSFSTSGSDGHSYCANCGIAKQWPDAQMLDASKVSDDWANAPVGQWVPYTPWGSYQANWPAWENGVSYSEIAEDGRNDPGALHLVSAGKNIGVVINPGLVAGETYTLGLWAKGTSNTGKVLAVYGHGDPVVISASTDLGADWTYYSVSFTADRPGMALFTSDWGTETDLYIDNITLKNAFGADMLAGYGDFYTEIDPSLTAKAITLDTSKLDDLYEAPSDQWVPFTPWANYQDAWPVWETGVNYGQIVAAGNKDAGALHLVSAPGKNTGVVINPGMTVGETYTLGMWVKGTTSNPNRTLVMYGNGDGSIIGAAEYSADGVVAATSVSSHWTYMEKSFVANSTCLAIFAADWGNNDLYIDNITLKNAAGTDLLNGNGDFCEYVVAEEPAELMSIDTSVAYPSYGGAPTGKWSVMYEIGEPTQYWPAWNSDRPYGEIVAEGNLDAGSLHLASDGTKNVGVAIGVNMVNGQTYTLGLWAKGTSNSGKVLFSYGNGDAIIIGASQNLSADWTYYEVTITADVRKQLNLVASDWGTTDVYIDNVTLKDSNGVDLLKGCGNFCKIEVVEPVVEGLGEITNGAERIFQWYWNGMTYPETDYSTVKISGFGAKDPGSLHIWQSTTGSADVNLAMMTSMARTIDGEYTLSLKVKGSFSNISETFCIYPAYCNDEQMRSLSIPAKLQQVTGVTPNAEGMYVVDEWTELTWTLPADPTDGDNGFTYLAMMFSKYNNTCEYYVDNIRILDPNGNDVLGGAGSFMDSGSEYFPIILPADGAEIVNSNTMYYMFYAGESNVSISNMEEYGYTAGDQNFSVTYDGMTQSASNKNVTMQMAPVAEGQPIVFAITSTASSVDIPESLLEAVGRAGEFNIYEVVITPADCSHSYSDWNVTVAPTYTAAGSQSKTCSLCGDVVTEEIAVLANPVTVWNITLKDNIGVNFQMSLAETDVVTVTVNGSAVDCTITNGKLSVNVAAAQMMDEIAISVNGLPLANTYSVRKYADVILADSTKSDCHELVKNMLAYGGAAQNYFGYNNAAENLASNGITVDARIPAGDGEVVTSGKAAGVNFYGASLVCRDKVAVRFYFTGSLEDLTVSANGGEAVIGTKNDMTYVEVSGINPQNLGTDVVVSVEGLSVSYSPLDYIVRMYNKTESTDTTKALVQALYGYYLAAIAYTA